MTRADLERNARERARQVFNERRLKERADGQEIVLIFAAIYEQAACVLVDDSLESKFSAQQILTIQEPVEKALRKGNLDDALCESIRAAAQLLAPHCPPKPDAAKESAAPCLTVIG